MIMQANDGDVWLGGFGGLYRSDGFNRTAMHLHYAKVAKSRPNYFCGGRSPGGRLWFGFGTTAHSFVQATSEDQRSGLLVVEHGQARMFGGEAGVTALPVTAVVPYSDNGAWLVSQEGIQRFEEDRVAQNVPASQYENGEVTAALLVDEQLWIGTATGLWRISKGAASAQKLSSTPVSALANNPGGDVWLAASKGILRVKRPPSASLLVDERMVIPSSVWEGAPLLSLVVRPDGNLWVGSAQGLWLLTPQGEVIANATETTTKDQAITAVFEDRENTIWVGVRSLGLKRLRQKRHWSLGGDDSLPGGQGRAIAMTQEGAIWVATRAGLWRQHNNQRRLFSVEGDLHRHSPRSLSAVGNSLWATTNDGSLLKIDGETVTLVVADAASSAHPFSTILTIDGQEPLVGGKSGGLFAVVLDQSRGAAGIAHAKLVARVPPAQTCGRPVTAWAPSRSGGIWIGTEAGLAHWPALHKSGCDPREGIKDQFIVAIHEDRNHTLWLATPVARGLLRANELEVRRLKEQDGMPCQAITALMPEADSHLWVGCGGGITRITLDDLRGAPQSLGIRQRPPPILRHVEVALDGQPRVIREPNGRLWFATLQGVEVVEPTVFDPPSPGNAGFVVSSVSWDGRLLSEMADLELPGSALGIAEFSFRLPTFAVKDLPEIQAKIGDKRQLVSRTGSVKFEGIAPGKHRLEVRADFPFDGWNRWQTVADFTVAPLWHQLWWARMLAALGVTALATTTVLLRLYQIRIRRALLDEERMRIARDLHDGLGQAISAIDFYVEALKRVVTAPPASPEARLLESLSKTNAIAHQRARDAIWDLHLDVGEAADVRTRLQGVVSTQQTRANASTEEGRAQITFAWRGEDLHASQLSVGFALELERLLNEAIENALNHGAAKHVEVIASNQDSALSLQVRDDGHGFDVEAATAGRAAGHFGIAGMRERARRIDAELSITSTPGHGTVVALHLTRKPKL